MRKLPRQGWSGFVSSRSCFFVPFPHGRAQMLHRRSSRLYRSAPLRAPPLPVHDLCLGWEGAMSSRPCMRPGVEASSLVTSGHSWCAPSAQNPSPSSFPTGPPPHSLLTTLGGEHGLPSLTVRGGSPHALRALLKTLLLSPSLVSSRTGRLVRGTGSSWAVARCCKTCWRGRWIGAACGQGRSREGVNPVNGVGGRGAGLRLRVPLLVLHLLRSPCHGVPGAVGGAGFEPLVE